MSMFSEDDDDDDAFLTADDDSTDSKRSSTDSEYDGETDVIARADKTAARLSAIRPSLSNGSTALGGNQYRNNGISKYVVVDIENENSTQV